MSKFRVLSIDGGGIRGIVPALILAHIEERMNKPIHELFDAVAGTSTGAILALGLLKPGADVGRAAELANLYRTRGKDIFGETLLDRLAAFPAFLRRWFDAPGGFDLNDLWRPRYSPRCKQQVFEDYFGDTRLTDALLPVYITSYDTEMRCPVIFVSRVVHEDDDTYYEATAAATMVDAIMASSAAPTFFPPHKLPRSLGGHYSLVDGGVFANNPSVLAHAFFQSDVRMLSLGTGSMSHVYEYEKIKKWGAVSWAAPILKMTFDGQAESTNLALASVFEPTCYLRLQEVLRTTGASDDLDDWTPYNLDALESLANMILNERRAELDAFCEQLV